MLNEASLSVLWLQTNLSQRMDIVADNLANGSTPGFKGEMMLWATRYKPMHGGMRQVQELEVARDESEGALSRTNNPLDLAIQGDAFFAVQTPLGDRFTRNGRFSLDADGQMVNGMGYPVLADDGQPIIFSPTETNIEIGADGTVSTESGEVATVGLVRFADQQLLRRTPQGFFAGDDAVPLPAIDARVLQGYVEGSNVEPIEQVVKMTTILRDFRAAQQVIQDEDDRMSRAIQVLSGTR